MAYDNGGNGICLNGYTCCGASACCASNECCSGGVCIGGPCPNPCSQIFDKITCGCITRGNSCPPSFLPCGNGCCPLGQPCTSCGDDYNGPPVCGYF